ncbi:Methyltransferase type 11 [Dehalogenimonas lykanthroporepellens BL-DC-9]|jgi:demethylmenaquinone methyltransferase/2-methoxy-6-polyprenyl-1,4-benzoquinol methylase|nr:Methyltransferase type 11 [Dehalogenimonas lykanthroporepellens BL-DC-9]
MEQATTAEKPLQDPGFESETARKRKAYMLELFGYQAPKYDLHDDIVGMGIHRRWVKDVLKIIGHYRQGKSDLKMLDLACGTGFVTFNTARHFPDIEIDAFDLVPEMVDVAKGRYEKGFKERNIKFWVADAEQPFGENKYDIIATCFAFRNFANKNLAAQNVFKALKPGGMFIIQDMTKPEKQPLRGLYLFALKYLLPIAGTILGTAKGSPRYLYHSVMLLPRNTDIARILTDNGFSDVWHKYQSGGMGTVVVGYKK